MSVLSEASRDYAADPSRDMMDQLLVALMISLEKDTEVFSPGQVQYDARGEMQIELGMMQASDGLWYGVICTTQEEIAKLQGAVSVTVKLKEMLLRVRATEGLGGLIVDPGNGANCFLRSGEIAVLLESLGKSKSFNAAPQNKGPLN